MEATARVDTSLVEKEINKKITKVRNSLKNIVVNASTQFAAGAATYTPPSLGKATIAKKYWTRPVQYIPTLAKNKRATQEDLEKLRQGYLFKVAYTKAGIKKGTAFAYCKKLSQTKKFAKITTRGLSRVMWGKNLPSIGAKIPTVIKSIMKRSKDTNNVELNSVQLVSNDNECHVFISNKVAEIERYSSIAVRQGYKRAEKSMTKEIKQILEKDKIL